MANSTKKKYSIYMLGAGFSCPAGLPQANGLWPEIRRRAQATDGRAKRHFDDDLQDYIAYKSACDGEKLSPEEIAFEDFMAYLDVEHYLRLRGSDTFSSNGNETQILVKTLIGKILTERTPQKESIPLLYLEFARLLKPRDIVITFNYDVLLERALEVVGVEYRLFPSRYEEVYPYGATVDYSREEVIVLKMHGSIDWFTEQLDEPPVFSRIQKFGITPLTDGPRRESDPLLKICRVTDIDSLYKNIPLFLAVPTLLNPSPQKLVYSSVFHDFWNGLALDGGSNFGMTIIGFSMPSHDEYLRQIIYCLVKNYQNRYWKDNSLGITKTPLLIIDKRTTPQSQRELFDRYRFVDRDKATMYLDGLNDESIELLRANTQKI